MTLTKEDLKHDTYSRFFTAANARFIDLLIFVEDQDLDITEPVKANAKLVSVTPKLRSNYTAEAIFEIDRLANPVPLGQTPPKRRYFRRKLLIKQTTGIELANRFGLNGVIYLGLSNANIPATTDLLAAELSAVTKLTITEADIVPQPIVKGSLSTYVTFAKSSLGFTGSFRVDLATPILAMY